MEREYEKTVSLLLSAALVLGSMDMMTFASEAVETEPQTQTETAVETEKSFEEASERGTQMEERENTDTPQDSEEQTETAEAGTETGSTELEDAFGKQETDEETDEEELVVSTMSGKCGVNLAETTRRAQRHPGSFIFILKRSIRQRWCWHQTARITNTTIPDSR